MISYTYLSQNPFETVLRRETEVTFLSIRLKTLARLKTVSEGVLRRLSC